MEEKVKFKMPKEGESEFVICATNDVDYVDVSFEGGSISKASVRLKSK